MDQPAGVVKRVSKACDACKLRKVKCNGQERCQQCAHLGLRCIYSATEKKRSQGRRGRVIDVYKRKTSSSKSVKPMLAATSEDSESPHGTAHGDGMQLESEYSADQAYSPHIRYDADFFLDLVPDYMDMVYPVHPVITGNDLRAFVLSLDTDSDVRSFLFSFAACTLNLTRIGSKRTDAVLHDIETLLNLSIESMRPTYSSFHSTVMRAVQSMFIHNCLMTMQSSDAAFYYMRDAISCIQLLRIDSPEAMASLPLHERARRQRLYWQAFIHERFVAILDYRQAILPPLDSLPEDDPSIPIAVHEGFNQIIRLFRLLDPEFLRNWLTSSSQGQAQVTSDWVEQKSRELEGGHEDDMHGLAFLSTMQRADLAITREWLRTLVWRLAMSQTLLSSRSSKECLSLLFPVRLSQSLRHQVTVMSRRDIEVHGSSIVQKLFEITDTIADVLIHVPAATLDETSHRIDDYLFILDFVLLFPTLDSTRRGILLEKLERLQVMFPEVRSTTSSPNVPSGMELQSPTGDPWYHVTQSKFGAEPMETGMRMDSMAMQGVQIGEEAATPQVAVNVAEQVPDDRRTQKAAWNNISRRLSMATFANG